MHKYDCRTHCIYYFKRNAWVNLMRRKWIFTFLIGMCIGIVVANLFCETYKNQVVILSTYLLTKYPTAEVDSARLFQYCIQVRLMPILYIGIFSLTMFGGIYCMGYLLWLGFSFGALLSAATLQFGLRGVLLCVTGMIPQFLLYIPVTAAALYFGNGLYRRLYVDCDLGGHSGLVRRSFFIRYALVFFILFIVSIIGVFLESYVNPILFKKVLGLF